MFTNKIIELTDQIKAERDLKKKIDLVEELRVILDKERTYLSQAKDRAESKNRKST